MSAKHRKSLSNSNIIANIEALNDKIYSMMKYLLSLAILIYLLPGTGNAQVVDGKDTYGKLFDLFVMEKYEDCLWKANKYTENDKTKKDPEPYLYMAMAYYHIFLHREDYKEEDYKDPLKDALKYLYKYKTKDKKKRLTEPNEEFFGEITKSVVDESKNKYREGDFRKAADYFKNLKKFNPEDNAITMMLGAYQIGMKNYGEGEKNVETAIQNIKDGLKSGTITKFDELSEVMLVDGFMIYTNYLVLGDKSDLARDAITAAKEFLPNNKDILDQYSRITK